MNRHLFSAIILGSLAVLGSQSRGAETGVTDTQVTVGAITTESGTMAVFALNARAQQAYYDEINLKGGINGRKIKWIRKDCQGSEPKSVEATKELVERDQIFAMTGCNGGPAHVSLVKYLNDHNVPDLWFSDGSSHYSDPSLKMSFPSWVPFEVEGKIAGAYVGKSKKGKKVCFLKTKDNLGEAYMKGAMDALNSSNAKASIADKVSFGPTLSVERFGNQADAEVLKFKEEKCDVVMMSGYGNMQPNAIDYGFSQGYKPLWVLQSYNVTEKVISLLNEGTTDLVIAVSHMAGAKGLSSGNKKAWDDYETMMKKYDIPISGTSARGYAQGELFVETLRRAGKDLTRDSLVKGAESFKGWKCSLCLVPLNTSKTNHVGFADAKLLVIKDKQWAFLE